MRTINLYTVIGIYLLVATGCKKIQETTIEPIDVVINASYADAVGDYDFPLKDIRLTLTNTVTGSVLTEYSDQKGQFIFAEVASGLYDVQGSIALSKAQYESITGLPVEQDSIFFNGILSRKLNMASNNSFDLKLTQGRTGEWVLKQIYYAGSHTINGAVFRDQFIEIYNNTDKILYADSLYFGQVHGIATAASGIKMELGYFIDQPEDPLYKQLNWAKSIGITPANENAYKDYIYMKTLYRIPGNGRKYPVNPGESIVIAATAQNHKAPFTGTDGIAISVKDPSLTVDLSNADFEVYLGNIIPNPFATDVDNTNIPNVHVIERGNGRDMILEAAGRDAFVIFKTPGSIPLYMDNTTPKDFGYFPDPSTQTISSTTSFYYQIPRDLIIDAVQTQHVTANSRLPRKLRNELDAGATMVPNGQYSSQSVIRKTAKTVNGRRILMDTNNSTNDFDIFTTATPKGFKD